MELSVWAVILAVLTNKYVIIAVAAVVLYLNFVNYIISYKKRPKRVKPKKVVADTPAPKKQSSEKNDEEDEEDDDGVYVD